MRHLLVFIIAAILLSAFSSVSAESLIFSRDLSFGIQEDSEVTKLQEFLTEQGVYSGPITGNFFSLTLKAVKTFQAREGISPATGYFGPLTRTKANNILSSAITASEQQAVSETGSLPQQQPAPKTTNEKTNSLQEQITALLQQINAIQQRLQAQEKKIQPDHALSPSPTPSGISSVAPTEPLVVSLPPSNLNVVLIDKALRSAMVGQGYITLATLSISNPNPNEAVRLSEMVLSLSDFAKNISQLRLEIQLPIDDFGDSRRIGVKPESFDSNSACKRMPLSDGQSYMDCTKHDPSNEGQCEIIRSYIDCTKFDLSLFQNIVFKIPETATIPAGKSARVTIQGSIREYRDGKCGPSCFGITYVPGEYQNFGQLDSCSGITTKMNAPIICDVGNGLTILKKINFVVP